MSDVPTTSKLCNQPDERLVRLAAQGSSAAFEAIVERYRGPLTRACRGSFPAAIVDDAVQQTFINAWRALRNGAQVSDLRAWLYQIARNCSCQLMRDVPPTSGAMGDAGLLGNIATVDGGAHEIVERKLRLRAVLDAVASLPDRQRVALVSTAIDGDSGEKAAQMLGVNASAVRQLARRARIAVRATAAAFGVPVSLIRVLASRTPSLLSRLSPVPSASGTAGTITSAIAVLAAGAATIALPIVHHLSTGARAQPPAAEAGIRAIALDSTEAPTSDVVPGVLLWQPVQPDGNAHDKGSHLIHATRATGATSAVSQQGILGGGVAAGAASGGGEPLAGAASASEPFAAEPSSGEPSSSEPSSESPSAEPSAAGSSEPQPSEAGSSSGEPSGGESPSGEPSVEGSSVEGSSEPQPSEPEPSA